MADEKRKPDDSIHVHTLKIGATVTHALAVGAVAVGALAIGALAIGRLAISRARIRRLEIDELVMDKLHVRETYPGDENSAGPKPQIARFNQPTAIDQAINKLFGLVVGLGLGLQHNFLLQVRGRKSGRFYSTPVNVLDRNGKRYLVAPRGYTEWVRNAVADGTASLKKGRRSEKVALRLLANDERPEILKSYLDRYRRTVQRYFPVPAGSSPEVFQPLSPRYPVFELRSQQ